MNTFKLSSCMLLLSLWFHLALIPSNLASTSLKTYIIHLSLPTEQFFKQSLEDIPHSRIVYTYRNVMNGFAARLTPLELAGIKKREGFVYARPSRKYRLHTTRTPSFMGLHPDQGPWRSPAHFGKGVIIGVIDSGITPGHPSFSDRGVPPPPPRWKGRCEFNATSSLCNNKLIGARNFGENELPFDPLGHGTMTASIAAGNFVRGANVFGQANGTASGLAPLAHLAMYKLSDDKDSTYLAAIDAAIEDGVDVLSMSISIKEYSLPFYEDSIAIGSFAAMKKGIVVSCAAGNSGPTMRSVVNEAPWVLTVGASTVDREIVGVVKLGNDEEFQGETIGNLKFPSALLPLVDAADTDVKGKIVVYFEPEVEADAHSLTDTARAAATIRVNNKVSSYTIELKPDGKVPTLSVSNFAGQKLKDYIKSTSNPVAAISFKGTVLGVKTAPTVAYFSSRGPNSASPGILKPDIIGPGVNIVAASYEGFFAINSGTSFSCPHLSGVAALIKSAHLDWSPAMIKSAIMTTSTQTNMNKDPILDQRHVPANLFAVGAGHVNPALAMDPGLVYDIPSRDYISYLCSLYDEKHVEVIVREKINCNGSEHQGITEEAELNYPSFAVQLGNTSLAYSRTVTNVGNPKSSYSVEIEQGIPAGVEIIVDPTVLVFTEVNQTMRYNVKFRRTDIMSTGGSDYYVQGSIAWISARHKVRIPVSVQILVSKFRI